MPLKIALLGPPHSGKSCLREGLKGAIYALDPAIAVWVIPGQRDGEGSWYSSTHALDPELARQLKREAKRPFTWEFAELAAGWVRNCVERLSLIDTGGVADDKNELICGAATHAVLLWVTPDQLDEWRGFCSRVGIPVLAEFQSDYHATEDSIEPGSAPLRASVHHLERGIPAATRPAVQALAQLILAKVESGD